MTAATTPPEPQHGPGAEPAPAGVSGGLTTGAMVGLSGPAVPGHRPYDDHVVGVVGVALVDDLARPRRLLAARRVGPAAHAGRWELPGGKVEPGESWAAAANREIDEELGVAIRLGVWVSGPARGGLWRLGPSLVMGVVLAELTTPYAAAAPLRSQVHDELRWLGAGEAFTVPWLDGDLPVVEALVARMSRP